MLGFLHSLKGVSLGASAAASPASVLKIGVLRAVRGFSVDKQSIAQFMERVDPIEPRGSFGEKAEVVEPSAEIFLSSHKQHLVDQYLSAACMSNKELLEERLKKTRELFKVHDADTGSSSVQIGTLTAKIAHLSEHLQANHKDHASKRGLMAMLSQRQKLLKYLRRKDPTGYQGVINRLGLKDRTFEKNYIQQVK